MATYGGYIAQQHQAFFSAEPPASPVYPSPHGVATLDDVSGFGSITQGGDYIAETIIVGELGPSTASELDGFVYGKMYATPAEIDAGQVAQAQSYTISLWNAHLHERHLIGKSISQAGVTVDNGALPQLFYPTETKAYTIAIASQGPPTLNCTVTFTFTDGEIDTVTLTGFRAAIWPFAPQIPLSETIRPSTWIIESENGKEQRGKLRDAPRRSFSFECLLTPGEWRNAQNLLRNRQAARWILPSFEQAQFVTATYSAGDTVIAVDTTAAEYYVGGLACVWQDYANWYVSQIESKTGSSITLATGLSSGLSGSLRIMPASICKMSESIQSDSDRPGNRTIKLKFDAFEGPDLSGLADAITLGNYGVMTLPTEAAQISETIKTKIWNVDFGDGAAEWGSTRLRSLRTFPQKTTLMDRAAIYAFKRWAHSHHGAVPFWVPTRFKDFYLSANLTAGTTSFRVVDDGFFDLSYGSVAVAMFYPDGSVDYRLVDDIAEYSATETTITLTSATTNGSSLTPDEVRICFLLLCRLDGDLKLRHTGYDAEASFTVKEVLQ